MLSSFGLSLCQLSTWIVPLVVAITFHELFQQQLLFLLI